MSKPVNEEAREAVAQASGSASFTSAVNRDSLVPVAIEPEGQVLHRRVEADHDPAEGFSASRGHPVWPVDVPSRSVSMSVGGLSPGQATSNHRHAYETLVYVLEGAGYSIIEGKRVDWEAGDAFYVAPWQWHQHWANDDSEVRYLASTNLPMLKALGQTVLREEER